MIRTSLVLTALLATSLTAQTGTYMNWGKGCAGSTTIGAGGCISANYTGGWGGNAGVAQFALGANSGSVTRIICGFEFFASTKTGTATKRASINSATTTGAPGVALANTTINWTSTGKWHRAILAKPLIIKPNTKFFLVFDNPGRLPYMSSGTQTVEHWHSGPSWRGPYSAKWNYNIICCGQSAKAVPVLSNTGVPSISTPFSINVSQAKANSVAIHVLGNSNSTWGPFKLPLDLTGVGAPGCNLLVSWVLALAATTSASGTGSIPYKLPNDKRLLGVQFHNQWAVIDKPANSLGLAFSNGGSGTIGS